MANMPPPGAGKYTESRILPRVVLPRQPGGVEGGVAGDGELSARLAGAHQRINQAPNAAHPAPG